MVFFRAVVFLRAVDALRAVVFFARARVAVFAPFVDGDRCSSLILARPMTLPSGSAKRA